MTESNMMRPATASQRNTKLARLHSGANKGGREKSTVLVDTSLSSSALSTNSTRHSVTSRINRNSCLLCYLIFSTRHLNATLENRNFVEKFNTRLRFFAASDSLSKSKIAPGNEEATIPAAAYFLARCRMGPWRARAMWQRARANANYALP